MRPEILNPLFAEAEVLKGVGPQVAKFLKRLDVTRVVDVLYHLPTGAIDRVHAPAASAALLGRTVILELTPYRTRENRSGRGPMRVFASDRKATPSASSISTIRAGRSEACRWVRSAWFGQARSIWRRMADHPSRGCGAGEGARACSREPVYPLTEGLSNRRMGELAASGTGTRARPCRTGSNQVCRNAKAGWLASLACARTPRARIRAGSGASRL